MAADARTIKKTVLLNEAEATRLAESARGLGRSEADLLRSGFADEVVRANRLKSVQTPNAAGAYLSDQAREFFDPTLLPSARAARFGGFENVIENAADTLDPLEVLVRATDTTSDIGGLLPTVITDGLVKFVDGNRYVFNVARRVPMPPQGPNVNFPVATQRTTAGVQSSEGAALSSQKMIIGNEPIAKLPVGAFDTVTEQAAEFADPEFMQILAEDQADAYGAATELKACDAVNNAVTTNTVTGPTWTSPSSVHAQLVAAADAVRVSSKKLADVLFVGGTRYANIVGLLDSAGSRVYPDLNNVAGLKLVYSPGFAANFAAVGRAEYVQTAEIDKGLASLPRPSTMAMDVGYRGYVAIRVRAEGICGFA